VTTFYYVLVCTLHSGIDFRKLDQRVFEEGVPGDGRKGRTGRTGRKGRKGRKEGK
jgi:hypothetical protein